ncbi:hypothetical protein MRX96_021756 [Rhipicephalus microplus]
MHRRDLLWHHLWPRCPLACSTTWNGALGGRGYDCPVPTGLSWLAAMCRQTFGARLCHKRGVHVAGAQPQTCSEEHSSHLMMPSHNAFLTQRVCYQRSHLCMVSLVLQMHDELLLEVCEADLNIVSGMVRKSMEEAAELSVPLVVRLRAGPNWAHLDDLE